MKIVMVKEGGTDFYSKNGQYDGHARYETVESARKLVVDVFDSQVEDNARAHKESQKFDPTIKGFQEASAWLNEKYGFDVTLAGIGVARH